jgi:hypothetical protein
MNKLLLSAMALAALAFATPASAQSESVTIDLTNINLPGTTFSLNGSVTQNATGGLDVSLKTDGFTAPDLFFHGNSGTGTLGFDLGGLVAGLAIANGNISISNATFFDPTHNVTTTPTFAVVTMGGGQAYDGFGKFTFNLECGLACQASTTDVTTLNFTIKDSAGALLLANLVNNSNGNLFGLDVWTDQGGAGGNTVATGFAAVQLAAAVPEPATWAMMLLGFIGLAAAFHTRRRIAGFA